MLQLVFWTFFVSIGFLDLIRSRHEILWCDWLLCYRSHPKILLATTSLNCYLLLIASKSLPIKTDKRSKLNSIFDHITYTVIGFLTSRFSINRLTIPNILFFESKGLMGCLDQSKLFNSKNLNNIHFNKIKIKIYKLYSIKRK